MRGGRGGECEGVRDGGGGGGNEGAPSPWRVGARPAARRPRPGARPAVRRPRPGTRPAQGEYVILVCKTSATHTSLFLLPHHHHHPSLPSIFSSSLLSPLPQPPHKLTVPGLNKTPTLWRREESGCDGSEAVNGCDYKTCRHTDQCHKSSLNSMIITMSQVHTEQCDHNNVTSPH